jgi:hypothetical protein
MFVLYCLLAAVNYKQYLKLSLDLSTDPGLMSHLISIVHVQNGPLHLSKPQIHSNSFVV